MLSEAEWRLAAVPAVTGAAAALLAPYHLRGWQLVTMLTVPIAAVASATVLPWAMAGASLSLLVVGTGRQQPGVPGRDPYRHIMWCRRREETAQVMVVHVPGAARPQLDALMPATRITDSVAVTRRGRGYELIGVMDGDADERSAIEHRFADVLGEGETRFGWATFPNDGFTLDILLDQARRTIASHEPQRGLSRLFKTPAPAFSTAGANDHGQVTR